MLGLHVITHYQWTIAPHQKEGKSKIHNKVQTGKRKDMNDFEMKFYLWQIIVQNDSGIVAGMITKIPILPKPVPMKHGHWNEWFSEGKKEKKSCYIFNSMWKHWNEVYLDFDLHDLVYGFHHLCLQETMSKVI